MIKVELIGNWKQAWKFLSIWVYVAIGALPDIFDLAVKMEIFGSEGTPEALNYFIKIFAFMGVVARMINQGVKTAQEAAEAAQKESN